MTDSHAHLMMSPIIENLDGILQNFSANGGKHIVNATYDIESIHQAIKIHNKTIGTYGNLIITALGIHPETFFEQNDFKKQITTFDEARKVLIEFEQLVKDNIDIVKFIGETGLDYHMFSRYEGVKIKGEQIEYSKEIQKLSFIRHLELAIKHNLPVTIHCRDKSGEDDAIKDALKIICEVGKGKIKGSMHSYTGELKYVNDIVDLGLYIGFNPIITYKNAVNVREIVNKIPVERIMLETDCPLLPLRIKGATKYGQPSDIVEVAKVISEIKNIPAEVILKNSTNYLLSLL